MKQYETAKESFGSFQPRYETLQQTRSPAGAEAAQFSKVAQY
jgi:hypothetical protein